MNPKMMLMFEYWKVSFDTSEGCAKKYDGSTFETKEDAEIVAALPLGYYGSKGHSYRHVAEKAPEGVIVWPSAQAWAKNTLTYAEMEKFGLLPK